MFFQDFKYDESANKYDNYKKILFEIKSKQHSKTYNSWLNLIKDIFEISDKEINLYIKKIYFENLRFDKSKKVFKSKNCSIKNFIKFIVYYFLYFILVKYKKKNIQKRYEGTILIDDLESNNEVKWYNKLIELFNYEEIIVNKKSNFKLEDKIKSIFFPRYNGYDTNKISFLKITKFFIYNLLFSIKLKINLFYFFLKIIDDCFYYELLTKKVKVKYVLNIRHYNSNNIKNYFFNKIGAKICYIQKNVSHLSQTNFNLQADIFFCFGNFSHITNEKTFSEIKKNIPVGSFLMNYYYYKKNRYEKFSKIKKNFDIIYIGSNNFHPEGPWDTYKEYSSLYTMHLDWLKNLSLKYSNLKIIFKHHSNNINTFEKEYMKGSNVDFIDKSLNTYDLAFKSKLILSWGSTMIVEFRSITNNAFFLNPSMKNIQFLNDMRELDLICISRYEDLLQRVNNLNDYKNEEVMTDFCLRSDLVNHNIAKFIKNN